MSFSQFDGIVYINLSRRPDRKKNLVEGLMRLGVDCRKVHRLEAIDDPLNGRRGCLYSHLKALEFVEKNGWERGLILEDDMVTEASAEEIEKASETFFQAFDGRWDVFLLGGAYFEAYRTFQDEFYRIKNSDRAHAYVVHPNYFSSFRKCLQDAADVVKDHMFYQQSMNYAVDFIWKELQQKDRWFAPSTPLLNQSSGISDIELAHKGWRH